MAIQIKRYLWWIMIWILMILILSNAINTYFIYQNSNDNNTIKKQINEIHDIIVNPYNTSIKLN